VAPETQLSGAELLALCDEYDMDLFFVLAQGQLESHFGTRGLASKTNSVFNVLAYDGRTYNQICKNGKYENPNHSIEPYIKLLKTKYLVNGRTVDDLLKNFVDVSGHRYASDPKYERTLRSIYRKYSQIDSLVNTYNLYKQYSTSVII
jgi:flagellum-specific peptidoglycan hydrolase FlgJ